MDVKLSSNWTKIWFFAPNILSFFFFGVEKSKVANRLKCALPKFRCDRSEVRGVNGRSKFAVAAGIFSVVLPPC